MSQNVRDTGLTAADAWALADDRSTRRALRPTAGYAQQWVSEWVVLAPIELNKKSHVSQHYSNLCRCLPRKNKTKLLTESLWCFNHHEPERPTQHSSRPTGLYGWRWGKAGLPVSSGKEGNIVWSHTYGRWHFVTLGWVTIESNKQHITIVKLKVK